LRRMFNIVTNEYIKILMKMSTIIMLITVALVAIGYNGFRLMQDRQERRWSGISHYESYDEQINRAKSEKYDGWELQVEILTFLKENDVTQEYNDDDFWIHSAVYTMFEQKAFASEKSLKLADDIMKAIKDRDWKAYNKIDAGIIESAYTNFGNTDIAYPDGGVYLSKELLEIYLWGANYKIENEIPPFNSNWKYKLLNDVLYTKYHLIELKNMPSAEQDRKQIANTEEAVLIGKYRLDNNIEVYTSKESGVTSDNRDYREEGLKFWDVFTSSALGINVISVLIIIIAGSVISTEFSTGTIKYLLVNPVKRYKIFIAKYVSVLSFAFLMLLIYYVFNIIVSGIFFGFGDLGAPYLYVSSGKVAVGSGFLFVALKYLIASVGMICMATLAFAISSVARSSALSIGMGVFLYLSGYGVVAVMSQLKLDFGRYIIFSNLELNAIAEGVSIYKGQTFAFALTVISVYMAVFILTAWDGFVRRDVK